MDCCQGFANLLRLVSKDPDVQATGGKELEYLSQVLQSNDACHVPVAFIKLLFKLPVLSKDVRKLFKSNMMKIHKQCPVEIEDAVFECLEAEFNSKPGSDASCSITSFLLEDCPFTHDLMRPYFKDILKMTWESFESAVKLESERTSKHNINELSCCVRLAVQVVQFMKDQVIRVIGETGSESHKRLFSLFSNCVEIIQRPKEFTSSECHLCAVFVAQLINTLEDDRDISTVMMGLSDKMHQIAARKGRSEFMGIKFLDNVTTDDLETYKITLMKGLLSCVRPSPFIAEAGNEHPTFLHKSFEFICTALQSLGDHKYHVFQVLKLWWLVVSKLVGSPKKELVLKYFCENGYFMKKNVELLTNHWDDPISGVSALVLQIFTLLVRVHLQIDAMSENKPDSVTDFLKSTFHNLFHLSPTVKGKYDFLTTLISHVGTNFLLEKYPDLLDSLVPLLGVNHLYPAVSKMYCAIVTESMKSCKALNIADVWKNNFGLGLVKVLFNSNAVVKTNGLKFWLPVHLRIVPGAYHLLTDLILKAEDKDRVSKLLAVIVVAKLARSENIIGIDDVEDQILQTALSSYNNAVRSEAFSLICCHNRSSDMVSMRELDLLKMHLPYNMNCDSPTFRQNFVFCVTNFLKRVCVSSLAYLKKQKREKLISTSDYPTYEDLCCDHVRFIIELCSDSMHVTHTYQRKKSALGIFSSLLSVFCSATDEDLSPKMSSVTKSLRTDEKAEVVLQLFHDTIPEIRKLALEILVKFFPLPSDRSLEYAKTTASILCRSPRAQENECGATMWEYTMICTGLMWKKEKSSVAPGSFVTVTNYHGKILCYLKSLNDNFGEDFSQYKSNSRTAAEKSPVHGWMVALDRCLQTISGASHLTEVFNSENLQCLQEVLDSVEQNALDVIYHILKNIFGLSSEDTEYANPNGKLRVSADFCEITQRIDKLILGQRRKKGPTDVLLTADHEVILACCWLCLLRGSALLSTVASLKIKFYSDMEQQNEHSLLEVCRAFVAILTGCRHRGAIEGSYEHFLIICRLLFSSKHSRYKAIPRSLLKNIVSSLKTAGQSESNITRRSAGIPMVIEAILVAEISNGHNALFHSTMADMIELGKRASTLNPGAADDVFDFPEVHALYILKHLFRNMHLGSSVLRYSETVFRIAYHGLSSPLWVVRNAATHLFGAVTSRMVGQKNVDSVSGESVDNPVPCTEFFYLYPCLHHFIVEELTLVAHSITDGGRLPNSGLHPVLTLLSKLTAGGADNGDSNLTNPIRELLGCAVLPIRRLAAETLRGLMNEKQALHDAIIYLEEIPSATICKGFDANLLHGRLMFVLLVAKKHGCESATVDQILMKLLQKHSLWHLDTLPHPLVASVCLQIVQECVLKCSFAVLRDIREAIQDSFCRLQDEAEAKISFEKPGMDLYLEHMSNLTLDVSIEEQLMLTLRPLIWSDITVFQLAALRWIKQRLHDGRMIDHNIIGTVCEYVVSKRWQDEGIFVNVMSECIDILSSVPSSIQAFSDISILYQVVHLALTSDRSPLSLQCSSLKLLSCLGLSYCTRNKAASMDILLKNILETWTHYVSCRTSKTEASEPLRESSAVSLEISGADFLLILLHKRRLHPRHSQELDLSRKMLSELICATLSLLHDEQPDVRYHVCAFVSKLKTTLPQSEMCILHQNVATWRFLEFVLQSCDADHQVIELILDCCFINQEVKDKTKCQELLFDKEPFNLYAEPVIVAEICVGVFLAAGTDIFDTEDMKQCFKTKLHEFLMQIKVISEKANNKLGVVLNHGAIICALLGMKLLSRLPHSSNTGPAVDPSVCLVRLQDCPSLHTRRLLGEIIHES